MNRKQANRFGELKAEPFRPSHPHASEEQAGSSGHAAPDSSRKPTSLLSSGASPRGLQTLRPSASHAAAPSPLPRQLLGASTPSPPLGPSTRPAPTAGAGPPGRREEGAAGSSGGREGEERRGERGDGRSPPRHATPTRARGPSRPGPTPNPVSSPRAPSPEYSAPGPTRRSRGPGQVGRRALPAAAGGPHRGRGSRRRKARWGYGRGSSAPARWRRRRRSSRFPFSPFSNNKQEVRQAAAARRRHFRPAPRPRVRKGPTAPTPSSPAFPKILRGPGRGTQRACAAEARSPAAARRRVRVPGAHPCRLGPEAWALWVLVFPPWILWSHFWCFFSPPCLTYLALGR